MRIAVTGEGIISAIGLDKGSVLEALRGRRTGIGRVRYLGTSLVNLPVAEVPLGNDRMKAMLGMPEDEELSRTILMGALAVRQALADASLSPDSDGGADAFLLSGTTVGGMDMTEKYYQPDGAVSPDYARCLEYHDCGGCTAKIASIAKITGGYSTISTACSSAANAIMLGADMIKAGLCDRVIAGGSEALSLFHLNGFESLKILDGERCRPFDATRAGLNLGEGAAYLVLESEESALRRGAPVHAWLTGYGNACDAFHQTASSPEGEGAFKAMKEALEMAGLEPSQIDYINAHGTGTDNNDVSESEAIRRLFGLSVPPFSSTKGFTGHTTSASGSIEAVICILSMKEGFIPANLGFTCPMEGGLIPSAGQEAVVHNVLCNSFGFGGNDSALVFSDIPCGRDETITLGDVKTMSYVEITEKDDITPVRAYVGPVEARRMGILLKSSLLSSMRAIEESGIGKPEAIITGTSLGCLDNSIHLLDQLSGEGEGTFKPSWFIQSTHNTIGSNIAIKLGCHGPNITVSQRDDSLEWAKVFAKILICSGRVSSVLVGCHDETTRRYRDVMNPSARPLRSQAMILTGDSSKTKEAQS